MTAFAHVAFPLFKIICTHYYLNNILLKPHTNKGEVFLETFMDAFDGTEPDFVSLDRRDGAYPNVSASGASGKASGALMLNAGT